MVQWKLSLEMWRLTVELQSRPMSFEGSHWSRCLIMELWKLIFIPVAYRGAVGGQLEALGGHNRVAEVHPRAVETVSLDALFRRLFIASNPKIYLETLTDI